MKNEKLIVSISGAVIGIIAVCLVILGNPANMGFCIACFLRDTAGALKLHQAAPVQYMRPEIIGLILGAAIMAFGKKELVARAGSNPLVRFILGFFVMVGALMFLGCPLRMMLRIGAGDLNAIVGLVGFVIGIGCGIFALNKGFSLDRAYKVTLSESYVFPAIQIIFLVVLAAVPSLLMFSAEGPGSMHAPIIISLVAGLVVGGICQRTRFCTVAGIRDSFMFKDFTLLFGFISLIVACVVMNLIVGKFNLGFEAQPIAHTDAVWNVLGMVLVGFASVLLGGCPLRQLILSGEGNIDSVVTVIGMTVGAAFCHNFGLASSGEGSTPNGHVAVIVGLIVCVVIACVNIAANNKKAGAN
ncbi:MAG: YedE-related selenium metabolism membrane protein [Clostridia bacterium]|nr:YedE-related selenium metabolism membrane protein [Clostridia bacterium]